MAEQNFINADFSAVDPPSKQLEERWGDEPEMIKIKAQVGYMH